ncbi:hypothetical protein SAMN04490357_4378 [Streptomyces misionensis]|uniref:Uncharacterized protein n=1 Tax=Streptomyces misionensis TaxID=67331 RepID=A0A1H4ZDU6_9ACTN|nr:hypothetical protein SAMN04490357_4378 [Streptomyces misionensis]
MRSRADAGRITASHVESGQAEAGRGGWRVGWWRVGWWRVGRGQTRLPQARRQRTRRARPRPDPRRDRPPSRGRGHVRDLALDRAPHQPGALGRRQPPGPGAGRRAALGPVVRRRERREIGAAGRPVPDDHGLSQREHGTEHHTEQRDHPEAPDGGGPPVGTGAVPPASAVTGHAPAGHRSPPSPGRHPGLRPAPSRRPQTPSRRHRSAPGAPTVSSASAMASSRSSNGSPLSTGGRATTVTRT